MIVCHCRKVTDRAICAAVREGAATVEHVAEMCGAGSSCGGCVPAVAELVERETRGGRRLVVFMHEQAGDAAE